ncbi:MAG TPA: rRNA maturation RNase YbeY [Roseateles sp.]|nr:rRNA maturation RNase YbeY [Roseateles sp.]HWT53843.1 rRNA maturation RNase YbeY [Rhodocyclaceae bacterium]
MATAKKAVAKPAAQTLSLSVQYACNDDALPSRAQVRRWVKKALEGDSAEVTVRFVDADEGQMLNREYRQKDYATNVLSFPYVPNPQMAGDLVLCLPVVLKEAVEQKKPVDAHFAHLIVHGMLHLQGYDHETGDDDAEIMEARERRILAALGYPDPYLSERESQA